MPPLNLSKNQIIAIVSALAVIILIIAGLFIGKSPKEEARTAELEFWGVSDDSDVYQAVISEFNKKYPKVRINYTKKQIDTYEKDLLNAFAAGVGPDIFMVNNFSMPRYFDKIYPAPKDILLPLEVRNEFVDVVYDDAVSENNVYGVPLAMDNLALFWNRDLFNAAGISQSAVNWDEFKNDVIALTKKDPFGNITASGAAIGTVRNINEAVDILSVLMLQSGTEIFDKEKKRAVLNEFVGSAGGEKVSAGTDALRFYTDFANPQRVIYTWNDQMSAALDSFVEGKTAMMFNYLNNISLIKSKVAHLNFGIAKLPQIKGAKTPVNYANYYLLGVSINSKSPEEAWLFLDFASSKDGATIYLNASKRVTARRDLLTSFRSDPEFSVFAEQALTAKSWHQYDNQAIEKIFSDMIESVIRGRLSIDEAVNQATNQININLREF